MSKIKIEIYPYENFGWSFRIVSRNVILLDSDQVWDSANRAKAEAKRVVEQIKNAVITKIDILGDEFKVA